MFFSPLVSRAGALCRARGKGGRPGRAVGKRPSARRASFERLEVREVLSPVITIPMDGVVLASVGATTNDMAEAIFLDSSGKIVVAGSARSPYYWNDFAALRFQADGTLDTTFGNGGAVVTDVSGAAQNDYALAAVAYPVPDQPDKIVLAGTAARLVKLARGQWGEAVDFALARYNADGSLDNTFNYQPPPKKNGTATFGTVKTDLGGGDKIEDAVIQDGKIVVGGTSSASGATHFALARYTAEGRLDTSFNTTGIVTTSFGGSNDWLKGVALQEGKILAAGYTSYPDGSTDIALARYDSGGTLDTTFGDPDPQNPLARTGKVVTDHFQYDRVSGVAVYTSEDLKDYIVVAGAYATENAPLTLARYRANGSLDQNFGSSGVVDTDLNSEVWLNAVALQPDDKIVVVGEEHFSDAEGPHQVVFLARYNTDGSLDDGGPSDVTPGDSFGSGGIVRTDAVNASQYDHETAHSVLIQQSDGTSKIVIAGWAHTGDPYNPYDMLLARYNPDGTLDASFGVSEPPPPGASAQSSATLTDAAASSAAEADYAALAAAAMYEQTASRTSAADQAFSDFSRTPRKNNRHDLTLDSTQIDLLLQR